jgi:dienelactone hydrolase
MAESPLPDPNAFDTLLRNEALAIHARDSAPPDRKTWETRRARHRQQMFAAMGPFPDKPCDLEPKTVGVLKRDGYRIEKLIFQSRPDDWVTATAYVPEPARGKLPAVLAVHGHWPIARRDPVVQARCLGLVKLGFFVLAVDAFGAGERYTTPASGTYHGALYGSTLWPVGQTLLAMQLYDNRRAVDYLIGRPEVDRDRLGVTGASGGGNQSMYAGALDERFRAVVPVCSIGTYQAYLHCACCVCEVLPGALRFAEEGDVLSLVAPRALLVVSATQDGYQFSVGEARKSLARARAVFRLYGAEDKLNHALFESPHAYNQPMREAMYGWMTRWLKEEGDGKPVPEPPHTIEKPGDLACYPDGVRPKRFLFPPSYAAREARGLLAKLAALKPDHSEAWESTAVYLRGQLRERVLGPFPKPPKPEAKLRPAEEAGGLRTSLVVLEPEPGLPVPAIVKEPAGLKGRAPACVLLHLDGKAEGLKHPLAAALLARGHVVVAPDLRATGDTRPAQPAIAGAPDHNSAEHALWVGRPLLGQWLFDVQCLLDWLALQPSLDPRHLAVAGIGQAGIVALCAAGVLDDRVSGAAAVGAPVTYVTEEAYSPGSSMGLLAPGILHWADVPHLAALCAPRRVTVAEGLSPQGTRLDDKALQEAYHFAHDVYRACKVPGRLVVTEQARMEEIAARL